MITISRDTFDQLRDEHGFDLRDDHPRPGEASCVALVGGPDVLLRFVAAYLVETADPDVRVERIEDLADHVWEDVVGDPASLENLYYFARMTVEG